MKETGSGKGRSSTGGVGRAGKLEEERTENQGYDCGVSSVFYYMLWRAILNHALQHGQMPVCSVQVFKKLKLEQDKTIFLTFVTHLQIMVHNSKCI